MKGKLADLARRAVSSLAHSHHQTSASTSISSLSLSADEKSLLDAFSVYGEVTEVRILYDKETGRSRGFGFIHFSKEDEATCARDAMDGKAFFGRPLRIAFALDKVRGAPVVVPRVRNSENAPVPERLNSFKSV
ncbi:glycine-rich RNA-binding protein 4, mitochondrial isoform X2 [Coffea arabica]|uniref:Glycine-rich RNA-binding protein 4, mitochondrial isoform X2 n=1 Tax=Coffea arabica TaxID=13443 RepID=A0A6P6SC40_COFAR|nr:glycine-rich RNA-binding protein 4, mitochondrial-like isoform X2 [Coffea arabica]